MIFLCCRHLVCLPTQLRLLAFLRLRGRTTSVKAQPSQYGCQEEYAGDERRHWVRYYMAGTVVAVRTADSMVRHGLFVLALAMSFDMPAVHAAVYEINEDGSVERIDRSPPFAAPPRSLRLRTDTRAARWRPVVIDAAKRFRVSPALIDAIANTESRYRESAVSAAGAFGIMQLMPGTARQMGVDRRDPGANILGGTAYIRFLLDRFNGDLVCTIAAYNAGPGAVKTQKCLPASGQTRAYVAQVMDRLATAADANEMANR